MLTKWWFRKVKGGGRGPKRVIKTGLKAELLSLPSLGFVLTVDQWGGR